MLELITEIIQKITGDSGAIMYSVTSFFFGALLGNYLAIGRDKRKEFNDATEQSRIEIRKGIDGLSAGNRPSIDYGRLFIIEDYLPWYEGWLFRWHVAKCTEIDNNNLSNYNIDTNDAIIHTEKFPLLKRRLKSLLRYIRRR